MVKHGLGAIKKFLVLRSLKSSQGNVATTSFFGPDLFYTVPRSVQSKILRALELGCWIAASKEAR